MGVSMNMLEVHVAHTNTHIHTYTQKHLPKRNKSDHMMGKIAR